MVNIDDIFLSRIIAKAWESQTFALPNPSVASLVLSSNYEVLSLQSHTQFGSAHAELNALKEAFIALHPLCLELRDKLDLMTPYELWDFLAHHHHNCFKQCSIYITLEPCLHEGKTPSCAKLLSILKPKKVVFGAYDSHPLAGGGAAFLQQQGIDVVGGVCLQEALDLIYPFLCFCQKGRFNLFKLAQRLNGNYKKGQISNLASKIFTHTQRSSADSLIVSGHTIRTDSPKLDTRFSRFQNKQPMIQILTRSLVATDCINAKKIEIHSCKEELSLASGFNIIEGGYPLLLELQEKLDCLLLIIAPFFEGENPFVIPRVEFDLLHSQVFDHFNKDVALWLKPKNLP